MSKEAIEKICNDLSLPKGDAFTQDWIYELPEEHRTFDSFKKYFEAYVFNSYELDEKKLLFNLMMDVTNDMLEMDEEKGDLSWLALSYILARDKGQFTEELDYWANEDEPIDSSFAITSRVRSFILQSE